MNRFYEYPTEATFRSPVYNVRAVPVEKVVANSYNPNVVAPPEMKLLELSIWEDGYTMPCVCYYDAVRDVYELVDGYHRYMVLKTSKRIYERERGLLPVAVIEKDLSHRMASTIRHNRARGTHNVELMSEIVAELTRANMSDRWIMRHIGMGRDELLRLKQITGLAELFADREFSLGDPGEEGEGERSAEETAGKTAEPVGCPSAGEDYTMSSPALAYLTRMVLWNGMNRETTARSSETANSHPRISLRASSRLCCWRVE